MTSPNLSAVPIQDFQIAGAPAVGAQVFVYAAGTTTKTTTYTDSTGVTPQTNPVLLNARGEPENSLGASVGIWVPQGVPYKLVFASATDTDPPTSPIWTVDNIDPLGSAAFQNTGTTGANVPLLNGTNTWSGPQTDAALATFEGGANMTPASTPAVNAVGYLGFPHNPQTGAYTTVMSDAGKNIVNVSLLDTLVFTIDSNADVPYPIGTIIKFSALGGAITLEINSDTLTLIPSGDTGTRSIAGQGYGLAEKMTATLWWLSGVGIT